MVVVVLLLLADLVQCLLSDWTTVLSWLSLCLVASSLREHFEKAVGSVCLIDLACSE